jgi:hypothetical protein
MGYLTTITIHNDALGTFKDYPKEFAEAIFEGIYEAERAQKQVSVPFKGYANYLDVFPSAHADDQHLYIHTGNTVFDLTAWCKQFKELVGRDPKIAKDFLRRAQLLLTESKKTLNELTRTRYKVISKGIMLNFLTPRDSYDQLLEIGDIIEFDFDTIWHILPNGERHESNTMTSIIPVALENGWIEEIAD